MSNLNVDALKKLFPKNTTRRQGGKVNGANRKRVQVMLPPDTLARLDELIEHDEQARSAAVALGVEVLNAIITRDDFEASRRYLASDLLSAVGSSDELAYNLYTLASFVRQP